jgi:hypothetical protein
MALFRKFFNRKRPDRLVEIADRVYGAYALAIRDEALEYVTNMVFRFLQYSIRA